MDIREVVTRKIIEGLEQGQVPWQKPWSEGRAVNHDTGKAYRGLNQLSLSYVAEENGWSNRWLTMGVIRKNRYRIGKGQSPQYIAFFKWVTKGEGEEEETFPLLRYYKVWAVEQMDGAITVPVREAFVPVERAEEIVAEMPDAPVIKFAGNQAKYDIMGDIVTVPLKEQFISADSFYASLFHELGHSTGHEKRLGRKIDNKFGDAEYSLEELVAEFTSAFLCAESGIDNTIKNSTAYIQGWAKVLKNDRQMVLTGASLAQKATDYILGVSYG